MSKVKVQAPIIHLPSYKRWGVPRSYVTQVIQQMGLVPLYPGVHAMYWYTDIEGSSKLLPNLILKSNLYKETIFTCITYAFKVWVIAAQDYDLNTWIPVIGKIPGLPNEKHAWNLLLLGDETGLKRDTFLYFEPNDGFQFGVELEQAFQAFPIGEEDYKGELVFY